MLDFSPRVIEHASGHFFRHCYLYHGFNHLSGFIDLPASLTCNCDHIYDFAFCLCPQASVRLTLATLLYSGKSPDGHHILVNIFPTQFCRVYVKTTWLQGLSTYTLYYLCVCNPRAVASTFTKSCLCESPTASRASAICPSSSVATPQFCKW